MKSGKRVYSLQSDIFEEEFILHNIRYVVMTEKPFGKEERFMRGKAIFKKVLVSLLILSMSFSSVSVAAQDSGAAPAPEAEIGGRRFRCGGYQPSGRGSDFGNVGKSGRRSEFGSGDLRSGAGCGCVRRG